MKQWWQMSADELAGDEDAQQARQVAYFNTFYGTDEGRQVLVDLKNVLYELASARRNVGFVEVYQMIRASAGANNDTEKAMVDAEATAIK